MGTQSFAVQNVNLNFQKIHSCFLTFSHGAHGAWGNVRYSYFRVYITQIVAKLNDEVLWCALIRRNAVYPQKRALPNIAPQEGQKRVRSVELISDIN